MPMIDEGAMWIAGLCIVIVIIEVLALAVIGLNEVLSWTT